MAATTIFLLLLGGIIGTTVGLVHAKEERAIAQAVNDFLQVDLLGQADIGNQPGGIGVDAPRDPNIQVRTVLDRAARKIEGRFANQPRVEAAIRETIAKAYSSIGLYKEAQLHAEKSAALRTTHLGADHADTLSSKQVIAILFLEQGDKKRAEPICREIFAKRKASLGADHPDTLVSMCLLTRLFSPQAWSDPSTTGETRAMLEDLVEKCTSRFGRSHAFTLGAKSDLAWMYKATGELDRAAAAFTELLELHEAQFGADHPTSILIKSNLGLTYLTQRNFGQAEPLLTEALKQRTALQGEDHIDTSASKFFLGRLYHAQGKLDRATLIYEQTFERSKAKFGDTGYTLYALENLVLILFESMQLERARTLLRELIDAQRKVMNTSSKEFGAYLGWLGSRLMELGQFADAEPLLREGLAIRQKTDPDHWTSFLALADVGASLMGQRKYADAEPLLLEGYRGMKQREVEIPAEFSIRFASCLQRLVQLYEAWGKLDEATKWRKVLEETGKEKKDQRTSVVNLQG